MAWATSTHTQDSHSMAAAAGFDPSAYSAQQSIKIKSFDPTKAEDFPMGEDKVARTKIAAASGMSGL